MTDTREAGSKGGKAAAANMTREQRKARARKAGKARLEKISAKRRREIALKAGAANAARWQKRCPLRRDEEY